MDCGWLIYTGGLYFSKEKGVDGGREKKRDEVGGRNREDKRNGMETVIGLGKIN